MIITLQRRSLPCKMSSLKDRILLGSTKFHLKIGLIPTLTVQYDTVTHVFILQV